MQRIEGENVRGCEIMMTDVIGCGIMKKILIEFIFVYVINAAMQILAYLYRSPSAIYVNGSETLSPFTIRSISSES